MTPNTTTTYTIVKHSLRGNQQYKNMKLGFKQFSPNLNAKTALSPSFLGLDEARIQFELNNH